MLDLDHAAGQPLKPLSIAGHDRFTLLLAEGLPLRLEVGVEARMRGVQSVRQRPRARRVREAAEHGGHLRAPVLLPSACSISRARLLLRLLLAPLAGYSVRSFGGGPASPRALEPRL